MAQPLTAADARRSLSDHIADKAGELRAKYGPHLGWNELQQILADRACVRYPCALSFDARPLLAGECAHPSPKGSRPEDGFTLHVHPYFASQPDRVPLLVLYQLVVVNYGDFASAEEAEIFGATALGIPRDDYYAALCAMADELAAEATPASGCPSLPIDPAAGPAPNFC